jgi:3-methylcrotonyl-CoA carboxylase alpha subunit
VKAVNLRHREEAREIRLDEDSSRVGHSPRIVTAIAGDQVFVWCDGATYCFARVRSARASSGGEHGGDLLAPMPGRVRKVSAAAGDRVERGMVLIVLEAMKMEHAIRAPKDGILKRLLVKEGDLVDAGVELAEIGERQGSG